MSFSTRLKEVLKEKGMTQTELAKVTHLSKSAISEWLSGKYEPKQDKIYLIAEKLSVSPSWLFGVSDIKEIKPTILEVYNQLEEPRQEYVYSVAEQQLDEQKKIYMAMLLLVLANKYLTTQSSQYNYINRTCQHSTTTLL